MSGFKQCLELAQSFQVEMADVDDLSVMVNLYSASVENDVPRVKFVTMVVSGYRNAKNEHFFQLIGDKITAESLAKLKEELKGLGYEI